MDEARKDRIKKCKVDPSLQVVTGYLQRRNYSDISSSNINSEQMKLAIEVESGTSRFNSIVYSCFTSDPDNVVVDHNYSKIVSWIRELHGRYKEYKDLEIMIAPLFCHLYLEIVIRGNAEKATSFFKHHAPNINRTKCDKTITELIDAIANNSSNAEDLKYTYRSNKYAVNLSKKSIGVLKKFLAEHCHVVLLKVLQACFQLNEIDEFAEFDDSEPEYISRNNEILPSIERSKAMINNYDDNLQTRSDFRRIKEAMEGLENETPPFYAVNLSNLKEDLDCGVLSRSLDLAAYSYKSAIFVTSLSALKQLGGLNQAGDIRIIEHSKTVHDLCPVPLCGFLISASSDTTVKLFDLNDFSLLNTFKGHLHPVFKVAVSSNGQYVVSASFDQSSRLWVYDRSETLRLYAGHTQEVSAVGFHPNSCYFATGSADKTIRLWSVDDGMPLRLFIGSTGIVYATLFHDSGKCLATAGEDRVIRIWDLVAGKQLFEVHNGEHPVVKLSWNSRSDIICSGAIDGSIKTWDLKKAFASGDGREAVCISHINTRNKVLDVDFEFGTFGYFTADKPYSTFRYTDME